MAGHREEVRAPVWPALLYLVVSLVALTAMVSRSMDAVHGSEGFPKTLLLVLFGIGTLLGLAGIALTQMRRTRADPAKTAIMATVFGTVIFGLGFYAVARSGGVEDNAPAAVANTTVEAKLAPGEAPKR